MVRLAGLALMFATLLPAAVVAQEPGGRFQLTQEGEGFLRLDTETGAVSFCQQTDGAWRCAPADMTEPGEDQADFEAAIASLTERLIVIETLLADLAAAPSANTVPGLDALREEVARLTEAQAALAATIATVEPPVPPVDPTEELTALRAEIAQLVEGQQTLAASLAEMEIATPATNPAADIAALRDEIARLTEAQQNVAAALAADDPPTDDVIAPALERIERMLTTLLAAQEALAEDQRSLATAQAALEVRWATFAAEDRLAGLETTLVSLAEQQRVLADAVAALGEAPDTTAALDALAAGQESLAADVAVLRETLAEMVALLIPPVQAEDGAPVPDSPAFGEELVNRLTEMVDRLRGGTPDE